jgi:hypothetical protein
MTSTDQEQTRSAVLELLSNLSAPYEEVLLVNAQFTRQTAIADVLMCIQREFYSSDEWKAVDTRKGLTLLISKHLFPKDSQLDPKAFSQNFDELKDAMQGITHASIKICVLSALEQTAKKLHTNGGDVGTDDDRNHQLQTQLVDSIAEYVADNFIEISSQYQNPQASVHAFRVLGRLSEYSSTASEKTHS